MTWSRPGHWCVRAPTCGATARRGTASFPRGSASGSWTRRTPAASSTTASRARSRPSTEGGWTGSPSCRGCHTSSGYPCISYFRALHGTCGSTGKASSIPNLVELAKDFAISDRTFEFRQTPSWGSHVFLAAATTDGFLGANPTAPPGVAAGPGWGCDSNRIAKWWDGSHYRWVPSCFPDRQGHILSDGAVTTSPVPYVPTIFDRLDAAGLTWKIYGDNRTSVGTGSTSGYGWTICPSFYECLASGQSDNLVPTGSLIPDAEKGTLPTVAIVTPNGAKSQHPPVSTAFGDSTWIGPALQAIMQGPEWSSTAVFITYDDFGGLYDHVNPLQFASDWGIRVPMVIVSPFAKPGYTDSTPTTMMGMLAFIEHTFGLAPLTTFDKTAYGYSGAFDFGQRPLSPVRMVRRFVPRSSLRCAIPADDPT